MNLDLEIISEEGEHPDPLFDSIMNAMNSMKEATADKIYRKIQKEGITNYSKPQVDKALESALKYGIFEVRNNRYRVRDDVVDDEDTVYWKLQKKKDQTPFRIEESTDDRHNNKKLNPERGNRRFRKLTDNECFHCGRSRRSKSEESRDEEQRETKKSSAKKTKRCKTLTKKTKPKKEKLKPQPSAQQEKPLKRKNTRKEKPSCFEEEDKIRKRKNINSVKEENEYSKKIKKAQMGSNSFTEEKILSSIRKELLDEDEESDISDTEMELLNASEPDSLRQKGDNNAPRSAFSSNCITADLDVLKQKRSSVSIKSQGRSEKSDGSFASLNDQSQSRADEYYCESSNNSGNVNEKLGNHYLSSSDTFRNQYKRGRSGNKVSSNWLGCSDEQEGAIIQSNNVLTIEPMDSLSFTEHASYIS